MMSLDQREGFRSLDRKFLVPDRLTEAQLTSLNVSIGTRIVRRLTTAAITRTLTSGAVVVNTRTAPARCRSCPPISAMKPALDWV